MESHLEQSCRALQAVGHSIQSMLGPNKVLKCYISDTLEDSSLLVDSMQVLDALMASYQSRETLSSSSSKYGSHPNGAKGHRYGRTGPPPALQFLYEACVEQKRQIGCGVTTLICMAAYWAPEILALMKQGVPVLFIFGIFHDALEKCRENMKCINLRSSVSAINRNSPDSCKTNPQSSTSSITVQSNNTTPERLLGVGKGSLHSGAQRRVLAYSRHFAGGRYKGVHDLVKTLQEESNGKLNEAVCMKLCGRRRVAMKLAMEAWHLQPAEDRLSRLPLEHVLVGKSSLDSRVVRGVVMNIHTHMCDTARSLQGELSNMVVFEGDCLPGYRHLGLQRDYDQVTSHDSSQLYEKSRTKKWLDSALAVVEKFQVNILVVGGAVCPSLWEQCIVRGVLVLKNVPANVKRALAVLTGAQAISYFYQCSKKVIGSGVRKELLEAGWVKPPPNFSEFKTKRSRGPIRACCLRLYHDYPRSEVATALLCGSTQVETSNLQCQLYNCWHRLHWATPSSHQPLLLPGGGRVEASCSAVLEDAVKSASGQCRMDHLPLYFTSLWPKEVGEKSTDLEHWKELTYGAFAAGLKQFVVRVMMNARPGLGRFEALDLADQLGEGQVEAYEQIDVTMVKLEAWSRAVRLLEDIFTSVRVTSEPTHTYTRT